MSKWRNTLAWLGLASNGDAPARAVSLLPTPRRDEMTVTTESALSLSTVYRGIMIHATATCQLALHAERAGVIIPAERTAAILIRPNLELSRSAFLEYTIVSLYVDGNAFWELMRAGAGAKTPGEVVDIVPLNPHEVAVYRDRKTNKLTYGYRGRTIQSNNMKHLKLLRVPGLERGLGPIQSARVEILGALAARNYGAMWLDESQVPDGILSTDQVLTPGMPEQYRNIWYGRNADGTAKDGEQNPNERLRVLGQGLSYESVMLKPADVQFLETQQFTTTQIARLLGTPASLLLAAVEGNSQTYSNVEQDWIAYARFSLMKPLREIEEAFTDLLPHGQTARFNLDALLRTDTKTRMESHAVAIDAGVYDEDEARAIEGLPPRTQAQIEAAKNRVRRPAATTEKTK